MPTIKLKDSEGAELFGTLPLSWHTTPLAPYAQLAAATNLPDLCRATAALLGLPEEPFLADASLLLPVQRAAPWLYDGSLPDAGTAPVVEFVHLGRLYEHVGNLETCSAVQLEALFDFLREHQGRPLAAAPALLAVLYRPRGSEQTAAVVQATRAAFVNLPMSLAWPALAFFLRSSAVPARTIQIVSELETQLRQMLTTLEGELRTDGGFSTLWTRMRSWPARTWLAFAKKAL